MHPALSIILFTSSSGAGYGLLALIGALNLLRLLPGDGRLEFAGSILAMLLFSAGLLSAGFHLGHPERAWRALSQWRSSWLSREGVIAALTYVPALLFAWACWRGEQQQAAYVVAGAIAAAFSMLTVFTTAMIYASLKSIDAWHDARVAPLYLLFALASGALLLNALASVYGLYLPGVALLCAGLLALAAMIKRAYWHAMDTATATSSRESATGLGAFGRVEALLPAHSGANYLMKEMGFEIARRHARKLRRMAWILLFAVPALASLAAVAGGAASVVATWIALFSAIPGILVERWLFFAEAKHAVMHYYR